MSDMDKVLEKIDKRFDILEEKINKRFDTLEDLIGKIEGKNSSRHLDLNAKIDELSNNLNTIETVTSKNWNDITKLKAKKIKKAK